MINYIPINWTDLIFFANKHCYGCMLCCVGLCVQFIDCVMRKDYANAQKLCRMSKFLNMFYCLLSVMVNEAKISRPRPGS